MSATFDQTRAICWALTATGEYKSPLLSLSKMKSTAQLLHEIKKYESHGSAMANFNPSVLGDGDTLYPSGEKRSQDHKMQRGATRDVPDRQKHDKSCRQKHSDGPHIGDSSDAIRLSVFLDRPKDIRNLFLGSGKSDTTLRSDDIIFHKHLQAPWNEEGVARSNHRKPDHRDLEQAGFGAEKLLVVSTSLPILSRTTDVASTSLSDQTSRDRRDNVSEAVPSLLPMISIISPRSRKMYDRLPKPTEAEQRKIKEFEELFQNVNTLDAYKMCQKNGKVSSKRSLSKLNERSTDKSRKSRIGKQKSSENMNQKFLIGQSNNDADQTKVDYDGMSERRHCETASESSIQTIAGALEDKPSALTTIFSFVRTEQEATSVIVTTPTLNDSREEIHSSSTVRPSTCGPLSSQLQSLNFSEEFDGWETKPGLSNAHPCTSHVIPTSARSLKHTFDNIKQNSKIAGPTPKFDKNYSENSSFVLSSLCQKDEDRLLRFQSERLITLDSIEGETKGIWTQHGAKLLSTGSKLRSEEILSQTKQNRHMDQIEADIERAKSSLPMKFLFDYKLNKLQQERGLETLNSIVARLINVELAGAIEIWKVSEHFLGGLLHYTCRLTTCEF